jgi:hypothetical protein
VSALLQPRHNPQRRPQEEARDRPALALRLLQAQFHAGPGGAPRSITGHLDFLQVRNDAVHILDYKPDARTNKPIAQLAIYALALTIRVPGLKLFDIKCAWFNEEEEYNEFFPLKEPWRLRRATANRKQ